MEARSERTGITQDEVIRGLLKEARYKGEGTSHSARVSAWAHLGRHLGMFDDKMTIGGNVTAEIVKFGDHDTSPG